jgi:hypothetical protein
VLSVSEASGLITLQLRSIWLPDQGCIIINPDVDEYKANLISVLITDIVLLIIMLLGLIRLRCHEGGAFRLRHILWKQVQFSLGMVLIHPCDIHS